MKCRQKDKEAKKNLRACKRESLNDLMDDTRKAAEIGNMEIIYENIRKKIFCNGKPRNSTAINNKEGNTITKDSSRLVIWKEH